MFSKFFVFAALGLMAVSALHAQSPSPQTPKPSQSPSAQAKGKPKPIVSLTHEQAVGVDNEAMACLEGVTRNDSFAYYDLAKKLVTARLRAPSTAKFPDIRDASFTRKLSKDYRCLTTVHGYADAQNGFGAQIRQSWQVVFKSSAANEGMELETIRIGK